MPLIALLAGIVVVAAALRNTQGQLFGALAQDVPAFLVWGAAIFAVGALGWLPGIRPVSRGLLALVLVVLVVNNYQAILGGFSQKLSTPAPDANSSNPGILGSLAGNGAGDLGALLHTFGGDGGGGFGGLSATALAAVETAA